MLNKDQVSSHISKQFNSELEDLRQHVLKMGGLVEAQLKNALESLLSSNDELAAEVVKRDAIVNEYEVKIDEECIQILAKRQPAASDLRLVMAVSKATTDLERIGDEARKIARMAIELAKEDHNSPSSKALKSMNHLGGHVTTMLNKALDAFARLDTDGAITVIKMEDQADNEYDALSRQLLTYMMEDPRKISGGMDVQWAARALERIADHAVNISEYVIYAVHGKDVRHLSLEF
jgi:phosphate transport system protein